jgi:hypothetical protein
MTPTRTRIIAFISSTTDTTPVVRNIAIRLINDDIGYSDDENAVAIEDEEGAYFEQLRLYFPDASDGDIEQGFSLMMEAAEAERRWFN